MLGPWELDRFADDGSWVRMYGPALNQFGALIHVKRGFWRVFRPDQTFDTPAASSGPLARPVVLADAMRTADEEAVRLGWILADRAPASPESVRELLALADLLPG